MQETYPYITEYSITPVNTRLGDEPVRLYFISCNATVAGTYGCLYFNIYKETDIFSVDNIEAAVKAYFAELERIKSAADSAAAIKESVMFGTDMLVSESIADALGLNSSFVIKDDDVITDIGDMSHDELYSKDISHFARVNAARAAGSSNVYTKDKLDAFRTTFFSIIKKCAEDKVTDDTVTGKLYNAVTDYYAAGGADAASALIDLVMSSSYSYDSATASTTCGCNSASSYSISEPCASKYASAMAAWAETMLSDITYFYNKFFYIEKQSETSEGGICYEPDTDLIDAVITLIDEFTTAGYDLSFSDEAKFNICACNSAVSSSESCCNYNVLSNYKKLLYYIRENNVSGNEGKIKSYGAAMGALVVKMMF